MLLYKAADLGMRLSAAFQSQTGIPFSDVNLQTQNVHQPPWTQFSSLSEVSTLSMEFTYLERAAGEPGCPESLNAENCLQRGKPTLSSCVSVCCILLCPPVHSVFSCSLRCCQQRAKQLYSSRLTAVVKHIAAHVPHCETGQLAGCHRLSAAA